MLRSSMTKRLAIVLASVLGALIIAATIIVVVVVNGATSATQESDYRACLEAKGVYDTNSTSDMTDMAETCYKAVYGE